MNDRDVEELNQIAVHHAFLFQTDSFAELFNTREHHSTSLVIHLGNGLLSHSLIMEDFKTMNELDENPISFNWENNYLSGDVIFMKALFIPSSRMNFRALLALSTDGDAYFGEDEKFKKIKIASKVVDIATSSTFIVMLTLERQVNAIILEGIKCRKPTIIVEHLIPTKVARMIVFEKLIYILTTDKRLYSWDPVKDLLKTIDVFGKQVRDIAASFFEMAILTTTQDLYIFDFTGRPLKDLSTIVPPKIDEIKIDRLVGTDAKVIAIGCNDYIYPIERLIENYIPENEKPLEYASKFSIRRYWQSIRKGGCDDSDPSLIFLNAISSGFDSIEKKKRWLAPRLKKHLRHQLSDPKLKSHEIIKLFLTDPELENVSIPFAVVINCNPIVERLFRSSPQEREMLRGTPFDFIVSTFKALTELGHAIRFLLPLSFYQKPIIVEKITAIFEQMNSFIAKQEEPCHDVVLAVDGQETENIEMIYACRAYLELVSPYLKMKLNYWELEGKQSPVLFNGLEMQKSASRNAFRLYIEFLHTGKVDIATSDTHLFCLLDIGRCNLDQALLDQCVDNIINNLHDVSQCDQLYYLAEYFDLPQLKRRLDDFVIMQAGE